MLLPDVVGLRDWFAWSTETIFDSFVGLVLAPAWARFFVGELNAELPLGVFRNGRAFLARHSQ